MDISNLTTRIRLRSLALLLVITAGTILVHGFHPYVEDAEIYVPGIRKILNPTLYPQNPGFFASHARLTLFPNLIAASVRITHLPLDWALLAWHFFSIFLLLLACWHLGGLAFRDPLARWGGVALIAALLTMPVAGTALYIMDQYLNPRSLSTPAVLFIVIDTAEHRWFRALLWILFTALIHPLMIVFGVAYAAILLAVERGEKRSSGAIAATAVALFFPLGLFPPVSDVYREVLQRHSEFFLLHWEWYEWLGLLAPIPIVWWFERIARRQELRMLARLCRTLLIFQIVFLAISLAITIPAGLANLAELQPMRSLQLVYVMLFTFAGGWLAQSVLRGRGWRWLALLVPLCAGMYYAQRALFPATAHIEWPRATTRNPWVAAFLWVRQNTPPDAYFALDPDYMEAPDEDYHGFRAIAERSRMADRVKDSGVVSMFPAMGNVWQQQVHALDGWKNFQRQDFLALRQKFGVNWVVLERSRGENSNLLPCPYAKQGIQVCRIE